MKPVMRSMFEMRPWIWSALLFFSQAIGAVAVVFLFQLKMTDFIPSVSLLVFGAGLSLILNRLDKPLSSSSVFGWIPPIIYSLFIFSLSNRSYPDAQPLFSTKLFHPIEYMTLAVLFCILLRSMLRQKRTILFTATVLMAVALLGAVDETHQLFIPGRTGRYQDVLIDIGGGMIGLCLFFLMRFCNNFITETNLRGETNSESLPLEETGNP